LKEILMELDLTDKRGPALTRGRGVMAAQQTFNSPGGGSKGGRRAVARIKADRGSP